MSSSRRQSSTPSSPISPSTPTHTQYESFRDLVTSNPSTSTSTPPHSSPRRGFFGSAGGGGGGVTNNSGSGGESPTSRLWGSGFSGIVPGVNSTPSGAVVGAESGSDGEGDGNGRRGIGSGGGASGKGKGRAGAIGKEGGGEKLLSSGGLVKLTIGLAGAQLAWTTEMAFGTPYLLSLGLTKQGTSLVWLAGPLSGLLVQPIIGALSDASFSRYRRRVFIVASAVLVIVSTLFVAYAKELATLLSSLSGLGDWDPEQEEQIQSIAIAIGVVGFYTLDFGLNGLQATLRALILDQSPTSQQNIANAWHGRMTHIGNIFGYLAGYLDLGHWSGISWVGGGQFRKLAVISCLVMTGCVTVTCLSQKEKERVDRYGVGGAGIQWGKAWRNVRDNIKDLPIPVRRVCYVQFCAWSAWFPFLFYSTTYVAEVLYSTIPPGQHAPSSDTATRAGALALLLYALVAFTSGALLPWLSTLGRKPFTERRVSRTSKFGRSVRRILCLLSPRNFWTLGLTVYAVLAACTFGVITVRDATTLVAFFGIPWSINCWVPFALVMESIRELAPPSSPSPSSPALSPSPSSYTTPTKQPTTPTTPQQPFRASLPSLRTKPSLRSRTSNALTECSPLLPSSERQEDGTENGAQTPPDRSQAGATLLGIHNLSIVAPQFFVALVAAGIFKILSASSSSSSPSILAGGAGDDAQLNGSNDVVWVLRFGGLMSLVGVVVSRGVLETRSEREYKEFVLAEEVEEEDGVQRV